MFDKDRERLKLMIEKFTAEGRSLSQRFTTFFYGVNPIIVAYYAMVVAGKPIPMDLVDKCNRALSGLVVSEEIIDTVKGPDANWLPILVVDARFTGKACVPFSLDEQLHTVLVPLNLGQFVEAYGPDQLETLKGI